MKRLPCAGAIWLCAVLAACSRPAGEAPEPELVPASIGGVPRSRRVVPREPIDVKELLVAGSVTVIECASSEVPASRDYTRRLVELLNRYQSVMLRRIDLLDRHAQGAELTHAECSAVPYAHVYDGKGRFIYACGPHKGNARLGDIEGAIKAALGP